MLDPTAIREKFGSLVAYNDFQLAWSRECARLNPTKKNKDRLLESEQKAEMFGLEA